MTSRAKEAPLTEDQLIVRATKQWFAESSWSIDRFATELLVPALTAAFPPEDPKVLDTPDAYLAWKSAKGVQVGRILRGTTQFPLAWKWVWLSCLPTPIQEQIRKELLAIAGVLDIPLPHLGRPSDIVQAFCKLANGDLKKSPIGEQTPRANLARLLKEVSEVVANSAPAQDGEYNGHDDQTAVRKYMGELEDLIEAALTELVAVQSGTGISSPRSVVFEARVHA